jgi:transposase
MIHYMKSTGTKAKMHGNQLPEAKEKYEYFPRKDLLVLVRKQAGEIRLLQAEIAELNRKLNMDSTNSSIPPSSGGYGKPKTNLSLRGKTGKKRGGQAGHKGGTLLPYETPDTAEILGVPTCSGCGGSLADIPLANIQKRQVLDIPAPAFSVHEYR